MQGCFGAGTANTDGGGGDGMAGLTTGTNKCALLVTAVLCLVSMGTGEALKDMGEAFPVAIATGWWWLWEGGLGGVTLLKAVTGLVPTVTTVVVLELAPPPNDITAGEETTALEEASEEPGLGLGTGKHGCCTVGAEVASG